MFKKVFKILEPCRKQYILAIVSALIAIMLEQSRPLIIRFIIDHVLIENNEFSGIYRGIVNFLGGIDHIRSSIWVSVGLMLFVSAVHMIFIYFRSKLSSTAAEAVAKHQRDNLYDRIQKLPYDYHVKAQTGDLVQRCTSDVDTVRRFLATQFMDIFRIVFVVGVTFIILLFLNIKLALASVIIVPFIFIFSCYFMEKVRRPYFLAEEKEGEMSTVLQENLTGVRVVRAFAREDYEMKKFEEKSQQFRKLVYTHLRYLAVYWSASDIMCLLQIGIGILTGTYLVYKGEISVGTLVVYTSYINSIVWPFRNLGRILSNFGRMDAAFVRIEDVLKTPEETDTPGAKAVSLKGDIEFAHVNFQYEKNNPVLKDISFKVRAGETIAILGSTGSGKSSLMHLFLRLYDYNSGSIKINGTELRDIEKKHLRKKVGIVLQEPFLYSKTIMDNVKMAKDTVTEDEVCDAAKIANVHDVIEGFVEGYDTMVGERGVTLSGGQKQRVAIARTLVKDSEILIFDDSLSAVDTETDAMIRRELNKKSADVTTFIISQRITTLMNADRIFVMENGKITDIGTHDELLTREGLYSRIWDIQNMLEESYMEEV